MSAPISGNTSLHREIAARTPADVSIGVIPVERAAICWDHDSLGQIRNFHVLHFDRALDPQTEEHRLWNAARCTNGACFVDWGVNPRHTPLGIFAEMAFNDTLPAGEALGAVLTEFVKIQGCDWAQHMLAALLSGVFIVNGEHLWP
ncbi:MAG: hypothetical protein ACJ8FO_04975 [Sphingomicrobium sp.]